ncbi:MAG: outer membrane homotrimeric porin [Desulfomicrobium sp.]|nr:outer membrane homotrimeric porin [Pseudomonadota bacterium]MBV1711628.1 outer membrane homotrimeric porin [Desulfomicrobium sp.]MBU4569692.1 outer membrane homotrimeric porin [Pseudomonadota bacterium]MBU4595412.1 outer membrane homotrimeric porin [Pseudomonadota bacterium]MBV1718703.1 outer membrane homotrimeric porin [Desulfomicrobium sp.]
MKRFALVALVAALLFSMVTSASATELKVRGNIDVYGIWSANLYDFDSDTSDSDNYSTTQRMRTYFDYVANENLKAVLGLEMDVVWGVGDSGDWGTDGNTDDPIELKHAYLAFTFPDTQISVQAGLQYVALPSVFGNPVFDDDAAAITVSAPINEMFAVTVGYTRGYDGSSSFTKEEGKGNDDKDMAFIAAPITLDGFSIAPYFGYAWIGENAGTLADADDDSTVWVLGANAELTMFDPLTFAADLIYGVGENDDYETKGWYGALAASYKMEMLTATLFTTYFSGADDDDDEDNYLPTLAEGWGLTPYIGGVRAFSGSFDTFSGINADMNLASWVVGLKLAKIQFIDKLTHDLTIAYAMGTNDEDATDADGDSYAFNEEDSAWEIYFVNKYMIYENLAAINELGYFAPDFDDRDEDDSYFATVGFQYKF